MSNRDADSFEGDVAIVTGSTSGVGRTIATELASRGADVVVNGRSMEKGEAAVAELEDMGADALFVQADITQYDEMERLVDETLDKFGQVDVLVPNGGAIAGPLPDFFRNQDPEDFLEFCRYHYIARIFPIKAALEAMIDSGGGRIVSISSDAGLWPTPGEMGPGGPIAGVMMMTRVLGNEFSRWNIRVNCVSITVTDDTPGLDWILDNSPASKVFEKAIERQDFTVKNEDIAETVAFLAGERPITGQIVSVNGGVSFPG